MTLRAPGWYPDADGAERWWNGHGWTERTRDAGSPNRSAGAPAGQEGLERQPAAARNQATWGSLGLSAFAALGVALIPVLHVIAVVFLTLALAAIALGVQSLQLRLRGARIPIAPQVLGILIGSGSALAIAGALVLNVVARVA